MEIRVSVSNSKAWSGQRGGIACGGVPVINARSVTLPRQQRLYFLPLPQGQGSLRPIFSAERMGFSPCEQVLGCFWTLTVCARRKIGKRSEVMSACACLGGTKLRRLARADHLRFRSRNSQTACCTERCNHDRRMHRQN